MPATDPSITALRKWAEVFRQLSTEVFIRHSKESGLSMPQMGAMFRIQRGTGSVSDLGEELGVTSAAASQMLERLVQLGLILRTEDPHDRRVKKIVLTDKGQRALREALETQQQWMDGLAHTLSASEKVQVTAALNVLIDKARQLKQDVNLQR
ncbi:MAG TPA: MarR family transcriptional regulator [Anaerolineae bacterium]